MNPLLPTIAVSAPGKVLLAGGYLVLDQDYTGLVLGLNARIHVHIRSLATTAGVVLEEVIVRSPQFIDAVWEYGYRLAENDGGIQISPLRSKAQDNGHPNPFVEATLSYALSYIASIQGPRISPAQITILADDDYYTQPDNHKPETFYGQRFKHFGVKLWDAHKTGLGSSAALVTALSAALLAHYLPQQFSQETQNSSSQDCLHRLAQAAHCAAQGKVGSGFDVASAVYGSCLYKRFSPSLLEQLGSPSSKDFTVRLVSFVNDDNKTWDAQIVKDHVQIPQGLRLVMCDVDCGSQTPGMVKKVLEWKRKEADEANMLWMRIHQLNEAIAKALGTKDIDALGIHISMVRQLIQDMSRLSDVPIEPREQTQLLDRLSRIDGVIGGVVPGAGGYDAVALIMTDEDEAVERLQSALLEWNNNRDKVPDKIAGNVSLLKVREDNHGIQHEIPTLYAAWILKRDESID